MSQGADQIIKLLREKIDESHINLREIFESLDTNKDQKIDLSEFLSVFQQSKIDIDEKIIRQAFQLFDKNNNKSISYSEFLKTLYEDELYGHKPELLPSGADCLAQMRQVFNRKYSSYRLFQSNLEAANANQITNAEFSKFVRLATDEFNEFQIQCVFSYLDKERKNHLTNEQFCLLYEKGDEKSPSLPGKKMNKQKLLEELELDNKERLQKQKEEEKLSAEPAANQLKLSSLHNKNSVLSKSVSSSQRSLQGNLLTEQMIIDKISQQPQEIKLIMQDTQSNKQTQRTRHQPYFKQHMFEMELLLQKISQRVAETLKESGRPIKELFNAYCHLMPGYQNWLEFYGMINDLTKHIIDENLTQTLFRMYNNRLTGRISLSQFQRLITLANKISLLALKLKFQFGPSTHCSSAAAAPVPP